MRAIHKYVLEITDEQVVPMGKHPIMRHVWMQGGQLCVWVEVTADKPLRGRVIRIFGTGHPMGEVAPWPFIGTAVDELRGLVWHVYDGGVAA
jgi:hypothetical protein